MASDRLQVKRAQILIVEDDNEMRHLLADALSTKGYRVTQVGNGAEAVSEVGEEAFDLVITDVKMPKMDGLELLQLIKIKTPGLPVFLITAFGDASTLAEAYRKGASGCISKPFRMTELINAVNKMLVREAR